VHWVSNSSKSW